MIKAEATNKDGSPVLLLGLSMETLSCLVAGMPVRTTAEDMRKLGLPEVEVILCFSFTDEDMIRTLQSNGVASKRIY